jgi:hypothetical protein
MKGVRTICLLLVLAPAGAGVARASPITYEVFGTVTDPGVGSPLVAAGDPFWFSVTLDPANGPSGPAGNVTYNCAGPCAWEVRAGAYHAKEASPGGLRIITDPARNAYPYPFVVELSVMQNAPSLGEVYAALIVGASTAPLTGDFVLPTFDAFDPILAFLGIVAARAAGRRTRHLERHGRGDVDP